jgi:hypothetical protein
MPLSDGPFLNACRGWSFLTAGSFLNDAAVYFNSFSWGEGGGALKVQWLVRL